MKAFVTGSTGFLGIHLLQELSRGGWEIAAFHRKTSDLTELRGIPGVTFAVGDVLDRESLRRAMPEGVDAVFHAAASVGFLRPGDENDQYAVNQQGTINAIEVALEKKARRFIHTSSILTYDFSDGRWITEVSGPTRRRECAYAYSKLLADQEVEKAVAKGLDAVLLHPSAIFGAHDKATWSKMFREVQRGLHIPLAPPGAATVCHMRKVAQAHVAAFHRGGRGEHYVLGGPDATMMEIISEVARILGRRAPLTVVPGFLFRLFGRIEYRISTLLRVDPMLTPSLADMLCETVLCDSSKAERELGYQPSSLREMLLDCHRWMVGAGMLPARKEADPAAKSAPAPRVEGVNRIRGLEGGKAADRGREEVAAGSQEKNR
jgi:dihydroflavonol-4-reductase